MWVPMYLCAYVVQIVKVFAFSCVHGIQIPDLSTNIADYEMLIDKGLTKAVILNVSKK